MADQIGVPGLIVINADGSTTAPATDLFFRGTWNNLRAYAKGDAVIYNGVAYNCIAPISAPDQALGPGLQGIAPRGRLSSGVAVGGTILGSDPPLFNPPGVTQETAHAHCWQADISVSGTITLTWTVSALYPWDSNSTQVAGLNSPVASPQTVTLHATSGGICYLFPGAGVNSGGITIPTPATYSLTATNGTGTIVGAPVNPTPDTDATHWSSQGI